MVRTLALVSSLVVAGFLAAPAAQAMDSMMKDSEHMSNSMHKHMQKPMMKKDSMMKDSTMKGDAMKSDAMQK